MPRNVKYSKEQIEEYLSYAKLNGMSVCKLLSHFKINPRTFYMSLYRYDINTDEIKKGKSFNTSQMSIEEVNKITNEAKSKRISHKKACANLNLCYGTFRGALVRLHVKTEKWSNTYTKEDVLKVFNYAKTNHVNLPKACQHLNYKRNLIGYSAKIHGLKYGQDIPVFDNVEKMETKDAVNLYIDKGFSKIECFKALNKVRKISRGMIWYFYKEASKKAVLNKVNELAERMQENKIPQTMEK